MNRMEQKKEGGRGRTPVQRRELVKIGVKAGKSRRLMAQELGVTDVTIRRDLEFLGINADEKPVITRGKKVAAGETKKSRPSETQTAETQRAELIRKIALAAKKRGNRQITLPKISKPKPPIQESPVQLSPKEHRQQRLQEMLELIQSWMVDHKSDYTRAKNVVGKAHNRLKASRDFYVKSLPESDLSPSELRDQSRPTEMSAAASQGIARREEVCAQWLAGWLAVWSPRDEGLRNEVLNQTLTRLR
jgi:hypothetical protein